MNKNQQKFARYAQLINQVVTDTEAEQDKMSPKFEELKKALLDGSMADFDGADYTAIKTLFADGTTHYQQMLTQLQKVKVPAKLMGNHKLLTAAFSDFVDGCTAMVASLHDNPSAFDEEAFSEAEADQDVATTRLMKYIQKISLMA
ncbi:hypothetical protein [Lacticaseibacillus sp. GG6-2]